MSDLLNSASLVMIPSGYKEDVVYSQIPTSGAGDLSFTRASNGTRVNSAGLVEDCPWNLLSDSNTFTAAWAIGIGGGSLGSLVADPFGGTTAQVLNLNNNGILYNSTVSPYPTTISTTSIWMRTQSGSVSIQLGNPVGSPYFTKTITTTWTRFDIQVNPSSFNGGIALYNSVHGSAITIEIYGAQVNIGSTAKPYFPTTDRLNVPRLTYQNGGGGCPSLLLEKQSTNLQVYSENSANWTQPADGLTVSYNTTETLDPSGNYGAEKVTTNGGNSRMFEVMSNSMGAITASAFVKAGTGNLFRLLTTSGSIFIDYNLSTQTVTSTAGTGTITAMGNGWYRVSASGTTTITTEVIQYVFPNSTNQYMYFWGAQFENSSYATSYIPTTSSSATRVADDCQKTSISSLIGQTEGTLFCQYNLPYTTNDTRIIAISGGSDRVGIFCDYTSIGFLVVTSAGLVILESTTYTAQASNKVALAYKSGSCSLYLNGTQILSSATTFSLSATIANLYLGQYEFSPGTGQNGLRVEESVIFKTRLTNAELASLTTI